VVRCPACSHSHTYSLDYDTCARSESDREPDRSALESAVVAKYLLKIFGGAAARHDVPARGAEKARTRGTFPRHAGSPAGTQHAPPTNRGLNL
jgi:hypothetical protein